MDMRHRGKLDYRKLSLKERKVLQGELFTTLAVLGLSKNAARFLNSLLARSEIIMLGRRIQIAKRLLAGCSFEDIRNELRVGLATIHTVSMWLEEHCDGYRSMMPRMLERHRQRKKRKRKQPPSYHTYPTPYFLFNVLLRDMLDAY